MSASATYTTKSEPRTLTTYADLRFLGDGLRPNRITELLGVRPTTAYEKGEVYKHVRGRDVRGRTGLWRLSTKGRSDSADLREHLSYLIAILFPPGDCDLIERLQTLMREDGIEADVSCFWHGEHGAEAPLVPKDATAPGRDCSPGWHRRSDTALRYRPRPGSAPGRC